MARRRMQRRVAVLLVTVLVLVFASEPAMADVGTLPKPHLAGLSNALSRLVRGKPPAPHWDHLPRQVSGTAKGRSHYASAASTRAKGGHGHKPGKGKGELPAYTAHAERVAKGPSARALVGFNARTSKRVPAKSTATSDYFQNADGSRTRRMAQLPINYRDADGVWQPIDTRLRSGADGRWHEAANSLAVDFASSAADPALSRFGFGRGRVVSYGLQGAAAVAPVVSGSTATYRGVLPGTDLTLSPTALGIKESLVLRSASAANSWVFPLRLKGVKAVAGAGGSIRLVDSAGRTAGAIPPAYAFDSKVDRRSGEPATTHAVGYRLMSVGGRAALVMTLDPAWLHARGRVFPVTVDPSTDSFNATTTYTESGVPEGDHSAEQTIKIGSYDAGTHKANSFLQFPDSGIDGSQISVSAASLTLFDTWASTCTPERFDVAAVTQSWTPSQVTAYPGPAHGSSIGNLTPNVPNACANTGADRDVGDEVTVPLSTSTFNSWATGSADYGLAVYASTADNLHWKQFDTAYDTRGAPYLYLTYTNAVLPEVTMQSPPNGYVAETLTPQLAATGTMDPNLTTSLTLEFQIYDSGGTKVIDRILTASNTAGAQSAVYTVAAGRLKWNQTYNWMVQAYDGTNYSPDVVWQTLTTRVPQPAVTSSLSQNNDGHGFDPSIGNYTTSDTDADVETVGPALSVVRDYNSRDPRTSGAFGAGWSTVFDAKATEQYDSSGAVQSVRVTYPDGSEVGYGKNSDGSFSPPQGRFATFESVTGGYSLTDKNDTVYTFTQSLGSGAYGISSITDPNGRAENFTWASGHISTLTSAVSGRALHLTWQTPAGATSAHVATVVTDPATAGDASTAQTWTYTYTGDQLTKMCSPVDTTGCTQYGYGSGSQYHNQVLDEGAQSFWPLAETSGTTAASAVLANEGTDNATYSNVTLGQPGPLTGGTATAAGFNGTSSYVQLPNLEAGAPTAQSVSLWFKTSSAPGVLYSYSGPSVTDGSTNLFTPVLYIGSDGKLKGEFYYDGTTGGPNPISSSGSVADGQWHHVVLSGSWTSQAMWLDGQQLGTGTGASGTFFIHAPWETAHTYLGAGFLGGLWPDQPHNTSDTGYSTYFNGSIADAAFFGRPLSQADVADLYAAGTHPANLLTSVARPSGKSYASVTYDPVTTRVTHVTDADGGTWDPAAPVVTGSSQVYRASVLGANPQDYWRLGDAAGTSQAANEIVGGTATYNNATLGTAGPFADATAASFDGSSSYLQLPSGLLPGTGDESVSLWFKTTATNGVLFSTQKAPLSAGTTSGATYDPVLYVGSSGKLYGEFWYPSGSDNPIATTQSVADGKWHQVLLASAADTQSMYLDGQLVGSLTGTISNADENNVYVGTGFIGHYWPDESHYSTTSSTVYPTYFNGQISDVAYYHSQLSGQDAAAQWVAGQNSTGLAPMATVAVTDPGGKTVKYQYDALNGNRAIGRIDALGYKTTYGYDTAGFDHTITDPNGDVTTIGHDVRGNEVSKTTCQNQVTQACSTSYFTYLPDDTSTQLTPGPTNDLMATSRDGRSASAADSTYLTSYSYDAAGNRTGVTTPPVPGFPSGRTTTVDYTDGTTVAAADTGFAPAGLPYKTTSRGGAITTVVYFHDGDVASVTDPDGQVTNFTYDNLGRVLTKTVVSDSYPSGLTTSYVYDGADELKTQTDPPVTDHVTGAIHTAQTTTVYDADGQIQSQTVADTTGGDASRTISNTYNAYEQAESTTDANDKTTSFTYDAYGNKATETDPAGTTIAYAYDPNGNLLSQTLKDYIGDPVNPSPAQDLVESSRAYDPAGRLASITDSMGNTTSYTYTDNGLTATITRKDAQGQNPFVQQASTYDAAGNLTQQVTNNGATTTTSIVDAADRTSSTTVDPTGVNRTTAITYTPDDQVATSTISDGSGATNVTSQTYDPMGHVKSRSVQMDGVGSPVARWPLSQISGTAVTDVSGTGNDATASSDVTWTDSGASFPGASDQQIATRGPVVDTSQSFTVSAWAKVPTTTTNQTVVSQDAGIDAGFYLKYNGTSGKWVFTRPFTDTTDPGTANAASTNAATVDTWTHLAGVYDANTGQMTLYVDGTANRTVTDSTPINASGPLVIGNGKFDSVRTGFFQGSVSNVQVYSRALSAAEIAALHDAGRTSDTIASSSSATVSWTLDERGLPTSMTDPNGATTNYVYDEAGQQAVISAPAVNVETGGGTPVLEHPVTTIGYDTFGAQTEVQDPNGNITTTAYDAGGRKASETLPDYTPPGSSTPITATTTWSYDDAGNIAHVIDPLQHDTHYVYDQLGDVAQVTDPAGGVTHSTYYTNGELQSVTDPTGAQTQATYDFLGRKLTSTVLDRYPTATSSTTTSSYTASATNPGGAFLASTTTQDGAITQYGYDNVGEPTQVTDPAGATTRNTYDLLGRKTAVALADGTATTTSYDQLGDPVRTQQLDTDGQTVLTERSATFDGAGRQRSATDARGNTTTFMRDATGLVTQEVQPVDDTSGITTSFAYDGFGHRTRYTDGRGNSWLYTYNTWNLPESAIEPVTASYTTPGDRTSTLVYDAAGRVGTETLPGGVTITTGYDELGNVKSQSGTGADAATADRSFTYDGDSRLRTASTAAIGTTTPATSETFTYNDRGLLLTATGSAGDSSFGYNGDGLLTSRTDAAGTTSYTYDSADRLYTVTDPATGTQLTYGYDQLSQLKTVQYGTGGDTRTYDYDHLHRLKSDMLATSGGATVASITYDYDNNGNEKSKTTTGFTGPSTNTYTYDKANRLTSWNDGNATTSYAYDASGNRTQVGANVYTYDARDQLTSDGVNSYSYTARGTLDSQTSAQGTVTSTSDAYGQQVTQGTQTYLNDATGRVLTATTSGSGVTATFSYSGAGNDLASDGSNTYTRSPDGSLVGIGTAGGGSAVLAYTDQHEDVVGNFTAIGTSLTGSTAYDPLGNVAATTGQAGKLGYQSGWSDEVTGRVDMGSRWYNPAVGQFQNKDTVAGDPIPNSAAANPFAYVDDDPLTRTDPTGHSWWGDAWNTVKGAAKSTWHAVTSTASWAWNGVKSAYHAAGHLVRSAVHYLSDAFDRTMRALDRQIASIERQIRQIEIETRKRAARYAAEARKQAKDAYDKANGLGKWAYHATAKAVRTTKTFFKNHAAAIASFAASTLVFMGCEAAITAVSGGTLSIPGAIACGAAAGAVGGAIDQTGKCLDGQKGACSVSAFAESTVLGAAGGAIGGGIGGSLGGKLAESALGDALPKLVTNTLEGAAIGGISGGATGAMQYGLTCSDTSAGCSWSGLAHATETGAAVGAIGGAAGGVVATGAAAARARFRSSDADAGGSSEGGTCPVPPRALPHSFIASTLVLMADGSSKPISQVKAGDKVADAVPGDRKDEAHKVEKVIVTKTDHDFVDLTIATHDPYSDISGVGKLTTTDHHPFYDVTQAAFIEAAHLKPGDHLQGPGGHVAEVLDVRRYTATATTYDLTINGLHTYYVEAGDTPVLVHNCDGVPDVSVSRGRYPETAQHIEDAQAAGQPSNLTIDRTGAAARRAQSMRGNPRVPGMDRDEYPPAMFEEGGAGSSVRPVTPADNRGAGSSMRHQCSGFPDGTVVHVVVCE